MTFGKLRNFFLNSAFMKPVAIIIIKYSGILLIWILILWWAIFFSPFNIPELIPHTPIKTYGLFFGTMILTTLIFAEKELLRNNAKLNIVTLTLIGTAICFTTEVIFQAILSSTDLSNKLYHYVKGVTSTTMLCVFFPFFIAFQLKTKRTGLLLLFIVIFLILFKLLTLAFPIVPKS